MPSVDPTNNQQPPSGQGYQSPAGTGGSKPGGMQGLFTKNTPKVKIPERAVHDEGIDETFADLAFRPKTILFQYQSADEKVLLLVREHVAMFLWSGIVAAIEVVLPFALLALYHYLDKKELMPFVVEPKWWWTGTILWFLFVISNVFKHFIDWFYNVNIMTNQRFVDLDFYSFSGYKVKEAPLLKIQDASNTLVGPWQMIFNMGDLTIYTASDKTTFNLHNVPSSSAVRDFIMDTVIAYSDQFKTDDIINAP